MQNAEHIWNSGHYKDAQLRVELFWMVSSSQSAVPHRTVGNNSGFQSIHGSSLWQGRGRELHQDWDQFRSGETLSQVSPSSLCFLALGVPGLAGTSCLFQPFSSVEKQLRGSWILWQLRSAEERTGSIAGSAVGSVTFPARGNWKYMMLSLMKSEGGTRHGSGC